MRPPEAEDNHHDAAIGIDGKFHAHASAENYRVTSHNGGTCATRTAAR
jgi:hypothetical protein